MTDNWRSRASSEVEQAVETIAEATGEDADDMIERFEDTYGPVEELSDQFAREFNEKAEEDVQEAIQWASRNAPMTQGPPSASEESGGSEAVETRTPESSGGSDLTEEDIRRIVDDQVEQSVRRAVSNINPGGGGGGGGGQGQQNQLAAVLAQQFLGNNEPGPMAKFGNTLAQEAMKGWVREMQKPSLGDMIEYQMYKDMAPDIAESYRERIFDGADIPDDLDEMVSGSGEEEEETAD